jgi:single-stranded-DNA-specific exonuclease
MGLLKQATAAAEMIRDADSVTVISHIDADGIASEAVLAQAIVREGIPVETVFVRQLEPMAMHRVPRDDSLKIFSDLGAGQQDLIRDHGLNPGEVLIVDHHVSQDCGAGYFQVNGLDYGQVKLSAAGIAYLVARSLDDSNRDLAGLAVVGNVGDMMAREHCGLTGCAHQIAEEAVDAGTVRISRELNSFGLSTRPVHVCLSYTDDPYIPGISNNAKAAERFLERLGIAQRTPAGRWRVWEEFSFDEKRTIISALAQQLMAHNRSCDRLTAEQYFFPCEPEQTPLRNAAEFATLLNSCGRWAKPLVGSAVCKGDRGSAYREAEQMLRHHRSIIREIVEYIMQGQVKELSHLQYLHVGDRFPDTIVGIGAGIALSKLNWEKPIMILCYLPDDPEVVKVSMRTNEEMVRRGVDLQKALAEASRAVGGAGGGHNIAAGAFIPKESEKEFASLVNKILGEQSA